MKRLFLCLSILALSATLAHAGDHSIIGVVTSVDPGMMEVVTDSGDTRCVALEPDTKYRKWIMEKPWAEDPHTDLAYLRVGDRVRIRLRQDQPEAVARTVWVVEAPNHPQG